MPESENKLGRLIGIYGIAPAYLQRVVFIAVLSFVFFMGTLVVFYVRQNILYFLLSTAFLIVYLVTMFSWILQRRSTVALHENGLVYKNRTIMWAQIASIADDGTLALTGQKPLKLPSTLTDGTRLFEYIRRRSQTASA